MSCGLTKRWQSRIALGLPWHGVECVHDKVSEADCEDYCRPITMLILHLH